MHLYFAIPTWNQIKLNAHGSAPMSIGASVMPQGQEIVPFLAPLLLRIRHSFFFGLLLQVEGPGL
jgi:hypothetical protein